MATEIGTLPTFPEFTKLLLSHHAVLKPYTQLSPPYSDYSFPSLWCWNYEDTVELAELHGCLVVKRKDYFADQVFYSFLGNNATLQTLDRLFTHLVQEATVFPYLRLIPEHSLHAVALEGRYQVVEDEDNYDYVYEVASLATMMGRKYEMHRNLINRFTRRYGWETRVLNLTNANDWHEINNLLHTWTRNKASKGMDAKIDIHALGRLPCLLDREKFLAVGVYINGVLCGYTITELNLQGYATGLFEHADTHYVGIFSFLKKQTAIHLQEIGCRYWNHQQDSGLLSLRQSKKSFRPVFYLKKLMIKKRP